MSLLSDIDAYVARTGTPERAVGWHAIKDASFVKRLRGGTLPRPETVRRVVATMRAHPDGLPFRQRGQHDKRGAEDGGAGELPVRVDRDPCPACGVRGDIGCVHGRAGVNW